MNTLQQAVHVARKDARMARWFLLAFILITLFAGLQAAELLGANLPLVGWSGPMVFLLGLYIAGYITQADSPIRDHAFWATRPLQPISVFSAKLLIIVVLLLVVGVAHSVALMTHAVPAADAGGILSNAVLAQAVIFAAALLAAAITRDSRAFMLTLVLGFIGWLMLIGTITSWRFSSGREAELWPVTIPWWVGKAAFAVGAIALVAMQYRSGNRKATVALAIPLFALMAAARITQPTPVGYGFSARTVEGQDSESASGYTFTYESEARAPDGEIGVFGRVNGPAQERMFVLVGGVVDMRRTDGRTEELPVSMPMLPLNRPAMPAIAGARWLRTHDQMLKSEVSLRIAPARLQEQGAPSLKTATPVAVRGEIETFVPSLAARLPLESGAHVAFRGTRVKVLDVVNGAAGPEVKLNVSRLRPAYSNRPFDIGRLIGMFGSSEYALLDRKNGVAWQMRSARSTGTTMGFVVMLPDATRDVVELVPVQLAEDEPAPTLSEDLELLVFDWRAGERTPLSERIIAK